MWPVPVHSADRKVTDSEEDSRVALTDWQWAPVEEGYVGRRALPLRIRIGPERHGYVYRLRYSSGVYQCERGSDWANVGDRLFLYRTPGGPRP